MRSVETMRKIKNKKELTKLVAYMTMGDGGVYSYKANKHAYFVMNTIQDNEDYVLLCKNILENITTTSIYNTSKEGNRRNQYRLQTKQHPFFSTLRERIYTENYKGIDPHYLKLLDYEALSFLYMSDGSCVKDKRTNNSYNVTLNMKRLSYGDLFLLKKALKDTLNLEWNINRQNNYYYLRLRAKCIPTFMKNIEPFIVPSFKYKLIDS